MKEKYSKDAHIAMTNANHANFLAYACCFVYVRHYQWREINTLNSFAFGPGPVGAEPPDSGPRTPLWDTDGSGPGGNRGADHTDTGE